MVSSRDAFLVGMLLSGGALARFVLVMAGEPVTPNVLIAFSSLAIMVVLPSFSETIGIGLVSGIISALISRSLLNPAFLLSEPLGAAVCLLVFSSLGYHRKAAPFVAACSATIASGIVYSAIAVSLAGVRVQEFFPAPGMFLITMALVILLTALANAVVAGLLYPCLISYTGRNRPAG